MFIGGGVLIIVGILLTINESGAAKSAVKTAANVVPVGRAAGAVGKTARAVKKVT